ncbi:MAG: hypothetical protein NVS3B26_28970 [Mycobacteriales bacterium]
MVGLALSGVAGDELVCLVDLLLEPDELREGGVQLLAAGGEGAGEVTAMSPGPPRGARKLLLAVPDRGPQLSPGVEQLAPFLLEPSE